MSTAPNRVGKRRKKGPLETYEGKTTRIPIYDAGNGKVLLSYYAKGRRKLVKCSGVVEARKKAKVISDQLADGVAHVRTITVQQAALLEFCNEMLTPLRVNLSEAVREFVDARKIISQSFEKASLVEAATFFVRETDRRKVTPKAFPEVVQEFLDDLKAKQRSYRHWADCHSRLNKAAKTFRGGILDITAPDLERWLDSIKVKGRNRNNYRGILTTLFSFARKRGYLLRNTQTEAEYITVSTDHGSPVGIYTPAQISEILHGLTDQWVSFAAIGAFAGLRAAEIHRLEWNDVNMAEGHIVVDRQKDKTGRRRIVPIQDNLKKWLKPHAKESGWICPHYAHDSTLLIQFGQALKKTGVTPVHNGFRHSYASYRLAETQSAEKVGLEMNTSPRKLFQNYRELVTERASKEYFGVVPKRTGSGSKGKDSGKAHIEKSRKGSPSSKKFVPGGLATSTKSIKKLAPTK
jgi:integrase